MAINSQGIGQKSLAHRSEVFNPPDSGCSKSVVIPMQNRPSLFASWFARFHLERLAQDLSSKGLLPSSSSSRETLGRIELGIELGVAAAQTAIVIECVPENLDLKKSVFEQLGRHCRPETIFLTNTSSLVPSQLAESCRYPERMAALHFHLPVAISNVVDLMPHPGTDPGVVAAIDAFAREIGQVPIYYKREYHGYIFNSIFGAMQRQALDLVIQGVASFEDIDRSWMGIYKMQIGPFGMFDQIGLDTIAEIMGYSAEALNDDAIRRRAEYLREFTVQGFLGVKSNRGFYQYPSPAYAASGFLSGAQERPRSKVVSLVA
jgi:3-hydroxybutyryl-CoA dehydrogenase